MKAHIKVALLAVMLLAIIPHANGQVSIGITIGAPPPPRLIRFVPERPAPEFVWVEGYWYPVGHHYKWHEGYWTRPPYQGAHWVPPHHDGHQFFVGYWEGDRGRVEHDHHWDSDFDRDSRERERAEDFGRYDDRHDNRDDHEGR